MSNIILCDKSENIILSWGTHILVCEVTYSSSTSEKLNFRKFFKFQVKIFYLWKIDHPIQISYKFLMVFFVDLFRFLGDETTGRKDKVLQCRFWSSIFGSTGENDLVLVCSRILNSWIVFSFFWFYKIPDPVF